MFAHKTTFINAEGLIIGMFELTFLGTSAMAPTKERNPSSVYVRYRSHGILLDCGEGTQRQMKIAGIKAPKVTKILISHWHGDHVLGLPGLLQTLASLDYHDVLEIYGPSGSKQFLGYVLKSFAYDAKVLEIKLHEIEKEGVVFEDDDLMISAHELHHGIPCVGYVLSEKTKWSISMAKVKKLGLKEGSWLTEIQRGNTVTVGGKKVKPEDIATEVQGKKIGWVSDTSPCENLNSIAAHADLLISEATYTSRLEDKGEAYGHMTAEQSALLASRNSAKKLVLTHFSQRYKTTEDVLEEAQRYFDNVVCAYDFLKIHV